MKTNKNRRLALLAISCVALLSLCSTATMAEARARIESLSLLAPSCGGLEPPYDFSGRIEATISIDDCASPLVADVDPSPTSRNLCNTYGVGTHVVDFQYTHIVPNDSSLVVALALRDGWNGPVLDRESVAFDCTTGGPPSCAAAPLSGCRQAGRSTLQINTIRRLDKFRWSWGKGDATAMADFGDPANTATYRLCLYNATGLGAVREYAPDPFDWTQTKTGYKRKETLRNLSGSKIGSNSFLLQSGSQGRAKIIVQEASPLAPDTTFPLEGVVTIQLVNDDTGLCFESVFEENEVKKNQTVSWQPFFSGWGQFKAVGR